MKTKQKIFFSYAWADNSDAMDSRETIVDNLYSSLIDSYELIRDKNNLEYKGFISDFMKEIGTGDIVIVVISKKYLLSDFCMFELYEIARNSNFDKGKFRDKIFPIMYEFINFTKPQIIEEYLSYWEKSFTEWDILVKNRSANLSSGQLIRYDRIKMIYQNFGKLVEWIIDMNTSSIEILSMDNFKKIKDAIHNRMKLLENNLVSINGSELEGNKSNLDNDVNGNKIYNINYIDRAEFN